MRISIVILILGVSAIVSIGLPYVQLLLALSFIGLPVAAFLAVAPFLFIFALVWLLVRQAVHLGSSKRVANIRGLIATSVLFALPGAYSNFEAQRVIYDVQRADIDALDGPLGGGTIAFQGQRSRNGSERTPYCDGMCMHALLTGEADRFIRLQGSEHGQPFDPSLPGTAFYFERRDTCPQVEFREDIYQSFLNPDQSGQRRDTVEGLQIANLRILDGLCLIQEPATTPQADVVLFRGDINVSDDVAPVLAPMRVIRGSAFRRAGDAWEEVYRRSAISAEPMWPLFVPASTFDAGGGDFSEQFGPLRYERLVGSDSRFRLEFNWYNFVTAELGYSLSLETVDGKDPAQRRQEQRERVRAIVQRDDPPTQGEVTVVVDYAETLVGEFFFSGVPGSQTPQAPPIEDQEVLVSVLENWEIPLAPSFPNQSGAVAAALAPSLQLRYANTIVARLHDAAYKEKPPFSTILPPLSRDRVRLLEALGRATWFAGDYLQDHHLQPLTDVARNVIRNERASASLIGLKAFGQAGVAPLGEVLQQILEWREAVATYQEPWGFGRSSRYSVASRVVTNARRAMCEMGPVAGELLPLAMRVADTEQLASITGGYTPYWITTFVRVGMDPEELWSNVFAGGEWTREDFDSRVARAISDRGRCR